MLIKLTAKLKKKIRITLKFLINKVRYKTYF